MRHQTLPHAVNNDLPLVALYKVCKSWIVGNLHVPVLQDVTMEVRCGESVAVVGPSGAGKSTLLHVMALLTPVDSGEVWMAGRLLNPNDCWDTKLRQSIGIVFQDGKLLPNLNVLDNVCMPLGHRGMWPSRQRRLALEALKAVGVDHRLRHRPNQLSGGELMRITIARALVMNPCLLLADEPTGTLDSATGEQISRLLFSLVSPTRALVLITHHAPLAERADRIVSLKDGRLKHE